MEQLEELTDEEKRQYLDRRVEFKPVIEFLPTIAHGLGPIWFLLRQVMMISASSAGPRIGMSQFNTADDSLEQILCDPYFKLEANKAMIEGSQCEWFTQYSAHRVMNMVVYESPYKISNEHPFLGATPDMFFKRFEPLTRKYSKIQMGECKLPEYGMYEVPPFYYVIQMYMQMHAYGFVENNLLCVSKLNGNMRVWNIVWVQEFWDFIYARLEFFWNSVRNGVPSLYGNLPNIYHCMAGIYKEEHEKLKEIANNLHKRKSQKLSDKTQQNDSIVTMLPSHIINDKKRYSALVKKYTRKYHLRPEDIPPRYNYTYLLYHDDERDVNARKKRCYTYKKVYENDNNMNTVHTNSRSACQKDPVTDNRSAEEEEKRIAMYPNVDIEGKRWKWQAIDPKKPMLNVYYGLRCTNIRKLLNEKYRELRPDIQASVHELFNLRYVTPAPSKIVRAFQSIGWVEFFYFVYMVFIDFDKANDVCILSLPCDSIENVKHKKKTDLDNKS
ncbi:MAG: hypothetical protein JSS82_12670 [Bacteroidetes bacterium]|nr:hypothetical protein [Bacteroidota bacterium]